MKSTASDPKKGRGMLTVAALAVCAVLLAIILYWKNNIVGVDSVPAIMANKLEALSALRINLLKSVEFEKSAVMADTDEASIEFAEESLREVHAGERNRLALSGLIEKYPSGKEKELMGEFNACWVEFREIDHQVLGFAVQNTNLKAARLSFGAGSAAMRKFESELSRLADESSGGPICRLAGDALAAALRINVLHAPHIASPDGAEMDAIEKTIQENDAVVKKSLAEIRPLLPSGKKASLQLAMAAYDAFMEITTRVLELSRQNTNIKSFELSLNRKRKITAQCNDTLKSLRDVVQSRVFKATR